MGPMPHDEAISEIQRLPISGMSDEEVIIIYMIMRMGIPPEAQDDFEATLKDPSKSFQAIID